MENEKPDLEDICEPESIRLDRLDKEMEENEST